MLVKLQSTQKRGGLKNQVARRMIKDEAKKKQGGNTQAGSPRALGIGGQHNITREGDVLKSREARVTAGDHRNGGDRSARLHGQEVPAAKHQPVWYNWCRRPRSGIDTARGT